MQHCRARKGCAQCKPGASFLRRVKLRIAPSEFKKPGMGEIGDFGDDAFRHISARQRYAAMPAIADYQHTKRGFAGKSQRRQRKKRAKNGAPGESAEYACRALRHAGISTPSTICTTPLLASRLGRMIVAEAPEGA